MSRAGGSSSAVLSESLFWAFPPANWVQGVSQLNGHVREGPGYIEMEKWCASVHLVQAGGEQSISVSIVPR